MPKANNPAGIKNKGLGVAPRTAGKKSHACGPCRRLKRKCDLQIPCGTCQRGRNTKVDECMANPATPLTNIQEMIVPNPKFSRVPTQSSPSDLSTSPQELNVGSLDSSVPNKKKQKLQPNSTDSTNSYTHYTVGGPNYNNVTSLRLNNQKNPLNGQQHTIMANSPRTQLQPMQFPQLNQQQYQPLTTIPLSSQVGLNSQSKIDSHVDYSYKSPNFPNLSHNKIPSQPTPPPLQLQQQTSSTQPKIQQSQQEQKTRIGFMDQNDEMATLKQKLKDSLSRIQILENENSLHKKQVHVLQSELNSNGKTSISTSSSHHSSPISQENEFKFKYIKLLPSRIQTKLLVDFYLKNLDYIYHPLHHPSFRHELEDFWKDPEKVDIGWLSILFVVLCLAAIHLPKGLINIDSTEIERSHKIWFEASKECINIADSLRKNPSEFNIHILQVFSFYQLYFYATKRAEQLNEYLNKAVKDAFAMGLDKDDNENPNLLEVELKRRIWWDICGCDTFRALSLGTKPLIKSYTSTVPFPSNCNDDDITPDSITLKSSNVPTDNSFNIHRAHMMKILNGVFEKKHRRSSKTIYHQLEKIDNQLFKGFVKIDIELCESRKSWFFQLDKEGNIPYVNDIRIQFQHHMLHTCICIHRFRIYQKFLADGIPIAWEVAKTAAKSLFDVYRNLRKVYDLKNPLFLSQIHQSFTGSIIQSMLILLDHKLSIADKNALYKDVDFMLNDLYILGKEVFILKPEVLKESFQVLNHLKKSFNKDLVELGGDQRDIVSNVFGGRDMTESYLNKCTVSFIIDKIDTNKQAKAHVQQEQTEQEQKQYDYNNQMGSLITDDLLVASVDRFNELQNMKNLQDSQNQQSNKETLDIFKNRMVPLSAANPEDNTNTSNNNNNRNNDAFVEQRTNDQNGNIAPFSNGNHRESTPGEFILPEGDDFWNVMGQQGIDELNNMYYSEFSGYNII